MAAARRNFAVTALLVAALAVAAALLPSAAWVLGLASVLGLAGVAFLQGNGWRSGALLVSALCLGLVLVDAFAGILAPRAHGSGLVYRTEPSDWKVEHPVLGYGARPNTKVRESATYDGKTIYDVVYTIDADGRRATPAAQGGAAQAGATPAGTDTYLFFGDSFIFGSGLADGDTLAAQFARVRGIDVRGGEVRTANFGLIGYGPNHAVRAFEAGLVDRYADGTVKAVVTWLIPDHLRRVTGDASWLGSSPRYVLEDGPGDGAVRHTGSFTQQRWRNPVDGLLHLAGEKLAFVRAIGARQREEQQIELTVALLLRLQALAREKLGAPLVVLYSWPNRRKGEQVPLVERLAAAGVRAMDTVDVTEGLPAEQLDIPYDGHPTAYQIGLIAAELSRRLGGGSPR
jgi:hypothetical protein